MAPPESPMVASNGFQSGLRARSPFPRDAPVSARGHRQEVKVWMPSGKVHVDRSLSVTPTPRTPHPPRTPGKENQAPWRADADPTGPKEPDSTKSRSEAPSYMAATKSFTQRVQKEEEPAKKPRKPPRKPRVSISTESILSTATDEQLAPQSIKLLGPSFEETEESKSSTDTNVCVQDVQPTVVVPEAPIEIPQIHYKAPQQVQAHHKKVHKSGLKSLMCCIVPSTSPYD